MVYSYRILTTDPVTKASFCGTAWIYKGHVITAAHVVEGTSEFKLEVAGKWYKLFLIHSDRTSDTAILSFKSNLHLSSINSGKVRCGDYIHSYMSLDGDEISHAIGEFVNDEFEIGSFLNIIKIKSAEGASGSPVLNKKNEVIGMLVSQYITSIANKCDHCGVFNKCSKDSINEIARTIKTTKIKSDDDLKNYWLIVPIKYINAVYKIAKRKS